MDVYVNFQGAVKQILETQVVLFKWIKAENMASLKMLEIPHDFIGILEDWLVVYIQTLTHRLIKYIDSMDQIELYYCSIIQAELSNGLLLSQFCDRNKAKRIMTFWAKHIEFCLEIKLLPRFYCVIHPLEQLIRSNTQHVEYVLQKFGKLTTPPKVQKNLMVAFLEFFLQETQHNDELRLIASGALDEVHNTQKEDTTTKNLRSTSKKRTISWGWMGALLELQKKLESNSRGGNLP